MSDMRQEPRVLSLAGLTVLASAVYAMVASIKFVFLEDVGIQGSCQSLGAVCCGGYQGY